MKRKTSKKRETESSAIQNRCIWMTAGVISFKLCPLKYDCEHCDFDEVMRSQVKSKRERSRARRDKSGVSASSVKSGKSLFFTFSPGRVDEKLCLHPSHIWVRRVANQKWKLGVDRLLAYVLPPPQEMKLQDANEELTQGRFFAKLLSQAGTVPLTAPLSGHLVQVNSRLAQFPELVQEDPHGQGWLVEMDWFQDDSELEKLYPGPAAKRFLEEEAQHLKFLLRHRGIEINNIGLTLSDGGANIKHLHQILPGPVCLRLASELIVTGKQAW